jgi:hypothetical protein
MHNGIHAVELRVYVGSAISRNLFEGISSMLTWYRRQFASYAEFLLQKDLLQSWKVQRPDTRPGSFCKKSGARMCFT